jgi:hypothetical protein
MLFWINDTNVRSAEKHSMYARLIASLFDSFVQHRIFHTLLFPPKSVGISDLVNEIPVTAVMNAQDLALRPFNEKINSNIACNSFRFIALNSASKRNTIPSIKPAATFLASTAAFNAAAARSTS